MTTNTPTDQSPSHLPAAQAVAGGASLPAFLVYRVGKGCRQYPMQTGADFKAFASRHPYRNEVFDVIAVAADGKAGQIVRLVAALVPAWVDARGVQ